MCSHLDELRPVVREIQRAIPRARLDERWHEVLNYFYKTGRVHSRHARREIRFTDAPSFRV